MHVILVPFGSHGDVHPFLALGQTLRGRGHRVTFLINEHFGPLVRGLGFAMEPIGEAQYFEDSLQDPDLWHPRRSLKVLVRGMMAHIEHAYPKLEALYEPGETVAVGGSLAMVVRLAQEKLGLPAATVHLAPSVLHSDLSPPTYPGLHLPGWWPLWLRKAFFNLIFRGMVDPQLAPPLNSFRAQIGLPPVRDVMRRWVHSPSQILGFFPDWYGPPQPDWPRPVELVGFPLYDERDANPMAPELASWLDGGAPPIAFTPGSANVHGRAFFEAAAEACTRLGRRGVLLTRHAAQIPPGLPEGVRHVAYAPFSQLLPRTAALVHHGGIGTAAQAMAAGVPQLIMPLGHDQFDNAARMQALGIARSLLPARFRGPAVAEVLRTLIDAPEVVASCRAVASRFDPDDRPMERASDLIEQLVRPSPAPAGRGVG